MASHPRGSTEPGDTLGAISLYRRPKGREATPSRGYRDRRHAYGHGDTRRRELKEINPIAQPETPAKKTRLSSTVRDTRSMGAVAGSRINETVQHSFFDLLKR